MNQLNPSKRKKVVDLLKKFEENRRDVRQFFFLKKLINYTFLNILLLLNIFLDI